MLESSEVPIFPFIDPQKTQSLVDLPKYSNMHTFFLKSTFYKEESVLLIISLLQIDYHTSLYLLHQTHWVNSAHLGNSSVTVRKVQLDPAIKYFSIYYILGEMFLSRLLRLDLKKMSLLHSKNSSFIIYFVALICIFLLQMKGSISDISISFSFSFMRHFSQKLKLSTTTLSTVFLSRFGPVLLLSLLHWNLFCSQEIK